jgi:hypothetical protein
MKLYVGALVTCCGLFFVGCSGNNNGGDSGPPTSNTVNADGTCSTKFMNDLKNSGLSSSSGTIDSNDVQKWCAGFRANHRNNVSCKINDPDSGNSATVNTSLFYTMCSQVDDLVRQHGHVTGTVTPSSGSSSSTGSTCPPGFQSDYSSLKNALETYGHDSSMATYLKSKCQVFQGEYSNSTSCSFYDSSTGSTQYASASDLTYECQAVQSSYPGSSNPAYPSTNPYGQSSYYPGYSGNQ